MCCAQRFFCATASTAQVITQETKPKSAGVCVLHNKKVYYKLISRATKVIVASIKKISFFSKWFCPFFQLLPSLIMCTTLFVYSSLLYSVPCPYIFSLLFSFFLAWILGSIMCKIVPYIQGVSVAASVYSLCAVSIDRYVLTSSVSLYIRNNYYLEENRVRCFFFRMVSIGCRETKSISIFDTHTPSGVENA